MNSNQVALVGKDVAQAVIYISVFMTTLMMDSCDAILLHGDTLRFPRVHLLPSVPHPGTAIVSVSCISFSGGEQMDRCVADRRQEESCLFMARNSSCKDISS